MATLLKVLNNLADIRSAGGVALHVRTQARPFRDLLCDREARRQAGGLDAEQIDEPADPVLILGLN
jgi:hypothetical protein